MNEIIVKNRRIKKKYKESSWENRAKCQNKKYL